MEITPTWCPGCGNFGIWMSLKNALVELRIGMDDGVVVYGVGCHGNMSDWMNIYGVAALHGRTLPVAQGLKLANRTLPVIVVSGDGDCLGEGGNHFLHAAKRNPDITVLIHNNQVYGLTTGQASPTAEAGFKTKSTPEGVVDEPVNPLTLAICAGATFVARGFTGDAPGLTALIKAGVQHKGFAVIDILQPCVTFDRVHTYQWYRERIYTIETPDNKMKALEMAMEWGDKIPVGIFYKEDRPTSEDHEPVLTNDPFDLQVLLSEFI
jgi:2-oxoglutarate ferredoxin oxidoreductase subunit beta